jgi:hypothetical protein
MCLAHADAGVQWVLWHALAQTKLAVAAHIPDEAPVTRAMRLFVFIQSA